MEISSKPGQKPIVIKLKYPPEPKREDWRAFMWVLERINQLDTIEKCWGRRFPINLDNPVIQEQYRIANLMPLKERCKVMLAALHYVQ